MVTIRLALAVYCRSPAAYDALKSFGLLQLPSRSTLQAYTGAFLEDSGTYSYREMLMRVHVFTTLSDYNYIGGSHKHLAKEVDRFVAFKQQCLAKKMQEPQGDGVLIFDEVKVISRLMWNSRSQKIIGLAMSPEEMSSLHDAYQLINEDTATKQTSYILQFLWRDLTSSFDVVGPYFTSSGQLESKFIISCILRTLRLFHLYQFHTFALVCDGASSNVSAVKMFSGVSGAYSKDKHAVDRHAVQPWFTNVFDPKRKIFWLICPSHQVSY